jgi:alpha-galactosidase
VVAWEAKLDNYGADDSPQVTDVRSMDATFDVPTSASVVLHRWHGSENRRDDFGPVQHIARYAGSMDDWFAPSVGEHLKVASVPGAEIPGTDPRLEPVSRIRFGPIDGRSSDGHFPLFGVSWDDGGIFVLVGWTGQWFAEIGRGTDTVRVSVGLEHLAARLHGGEVITLPRVAVLGWRGDRAAAFNRLRSYVRERVLPRPDGRLPEPPLAASSFLVFDEGLSGTAQRHLDLLQSYLDRKLPIDTYWIDAGWFGGSDSWVRRVGDWFPDPDRFPQGLRPIADVAHENGLRFLVWFEPERVYEGTELHRDHPDWLIGLPGESEYLLDLGNPDARRWITERVSSLISSEAIDIYRQDLNFGPLRHWLANDRPGRLGISEIRHVEGLYAFWDELRTRHPSLLIDNCAGGGRRIDLGTMSRSVTLTRSDYLFEPDGTQSHTWGLSHLLPLSGVTMREPNEYEYRSGLGGGLVIIADTAGADDVLTRRLIDEYRAVRPYAIEGDVHHLTDYSIGSDGWMVIRFDRADLRSGVVLAFRRTASPFPEIRLPFGPVATGATYEIDDRDERTSIGAEALARNGLRLRMDAPGSARIIRYRW